MSGDVRRCAEVGWGCAEVYLESVEGCGEDDSIYLSQLQVKFLHYKVIDFIYKVRRYRNTCLGLRKRSGGLTKR